MNIISKFEMKVNEEKQGIELYFQEFPTLEDRAELKKNGFRWNNFNKCWYIKADNCPELRNITEGTTITIKDDPAVKTVKPTLQLKALRLATPEEAREAVQKVWNTPRMVEYSLANNDYYITSDGLMLEFEKVSKLTIDKTLWFDDEQEIPTKTESLFIHYNTKCSRADVIRDYLKEKERLETTGGAIGGYDYNGFYLTDTYSGSRKNIVSYNFRDYRDSYGGKDFFVRYLTPEEQQDLVNIIFYREQQYIERLKKYYKRYGEHVHCFGYWVNR